MHLSIHLSIFLAYSAAHATLHPLIDGCMQEVADSEQVFYDGPTSDGSAGIGAEFESAFFYFTNSSCSRADTDAAKRQVIAGRTGMNFMLTADTTDIVGRINAEYILDGKNIKVGSGDAARAGAAASQDLITWQPWNGPDPDNVDVANSNCNPWSVGLPPTGSDPNDLEWDAQITAPMPLEALYSLMEEQWNNNEMNPLTGIESGQGNIDGNLVFVKQDYFQSNTNGIDMSSVGNDVLGFCSLVLSYAKGASTNLGPGQSPKLLFTFMPRTEFNTIYQQVQSKIPGDLFNLFNCLACYTEEKDYNGPTGLTVIDTSYCSGSVRNPVSNNQFGALTYKNSVASVNIKNWIQGIGSSSPSPDLLSTFDASVDGSIGGLGTLTEKMFNSQRSVPLFEFRNLMNTPQASGFESFMANIDTAIQNLHTTFANPPQKLKRQDSVNASCSWSNETSISTTPTTLTPSTMTTSTIPASITPPPIPSCILQNETFTSNLDPGFCLCDSSITLPLLPLANFGKGRCDYMAIPSTTFSTDTFSTTTTYTQVLTQHCFACTYWNGLPAGTDPCSSIASCTPPPTAPLTSTTTTWITPTVASTTVISSTSPTSTTPVILAWVANLSTIDIGNADDGNGGADLAKEMFTKLSAKCPKWVCTSDPAVMDSVEAIVLDGEEPLKPAMYLQEATFSSPAVFQQMLSVGISTWIAALNSPSLGLCQDVAYEADADETGSGCGKGPITPSRLRRKVRRDNGEVLWERDGLALEEHQLAERCFDSCDPPVKCTYEARMCSAPNGIFVVMGDAVNPYRNRLEIAVTLEKTLDGFDCQALVEGLTAAMVVLAPQLLEADALEGVELEAICGIIDDPQSAITNYLGSAEIVSG